MILAVLDEHTISDTKSLDSFKAAVTDTHQISERKGKDKVKINSYTNYILISNDNAPVRLEATDRRAFVLEVDDEFAQRKDGSKAPGAEEYFATLNKHLTVDAARHYARFLLDYDISNFNPRNIPPTKSRMRLMENSKSLTEIWLEELVLQWPTGNGLEPMLLTAKDLYSKYAFYCASINQCARQDSINVFQKVLPTLVHLIISSFSNGRNKYKPNMDYVSAMKGFGKQEEKQ